MTADARQKPLLTVAEAGRELGIGTTTAYEWARRGELPGLVKLGGRWYVRRAVLVAYLNGADVLTVAPDGPMPLRHDAARRAGRAAEEGR
jgi:excisionase family DNA binding protein